MTELLGQTQRKRAAGSASAAATPGPSTGPPAGRGRGRGRGASAAATPQNQKRPAPGAASTSKKRPQSAPQPKRKKKDPAEIEWLDSESSAESTEEETSEEEELRDMEDDRRGELTARNPLEQQQGRYVDFILVLMYYPHNRVSAYIHDHACLRAYSCTCASPHGGLWIVAARWLLNQGPSNAYMMCT